MSKYIIKNCPVCEFSDWEECTGCLAEGYICNDIHTEIIECKDRTDCVLKRIVQLCRYYKKHSDCGRECPSFGMFLSKLLSKLDIQEVE